MMIRRLISERKHVLIVLPVRVQRVHILRSSRRRVLRLKRRGSVRDSNTNRDGLNGWDEHGVHLILGCLCTYMCVLLIQEREGGWMVLFLRVKNQKFEKPEKRMFFNGWKKRLSDTMMMCASYLHTRAAVISSSIHQTFFYFHSFWKYIYKLNFFYPFKPLLKNQSTRESMWVFKSPENCVSRFSPPDHLLISLLLPSNFQIKNLENLKFNCVCVRERERE